MRKPLRLRRYLVHFSSHNIPQMFTDVLVLGKEKPEKARG